MCVPVADFRHAVLYLFIFAFLPFDDTAIVTSFNMIILQTDVHIITFLVN
jgi:hypothetical protein